MTAIAGGHSKIERAKASIKKPILYTDAIKELQESVRNFTGQETA